jgi:hypothetical protein
MALRRDFSLNKTTYQGTSLNLDPDCGIWVISIDGPETGTQCAVQRLRRRTQALPTEARSQ